MLARYRTRWENDVRLEPNSDDWIHFGFKHPDNVLLTDVAAKDVKITELVHHASRILVPMPNSLQFSVAETGDGPKDFQISRWGLPETATLKGPNGIAQHIFNMFREHFIPSEVPVSCPTQMITTQQMADEATKRLQGSDEHYALRPGGAIATGAPYTPPASSPLVMTPRPLTNSPLSDTPDRLSPDSNIELGAIATPAAQRLAQIPLEKVDKKKHPQTCQQPEEIRPRV